MVNRIVCRLSVDDKPATELTRDEYSIGRADDCDILLPADDGTVSRHHAVMRRQTDGSWIIEDQGSRNGICVNGGDLATEFTLQDGDLIKIGRSRLQFRVTAAGDPRPWRNPELPSVRQQPGAKQPDTNGPSIQLEGAWGRAVSSIIRSYNSVPKTGLIGYRGTQDQQALGQKVGACAGAIALLSLLFPWLTIQGWTANLSASCFQLWRGSDQALQTPEIGLLFMAFLASLLGFGCSLCLYRRTGAQASLMVLTGTLGLVTIGGLQDAIPHGGMFGFSVSFSYGVYLFGLASLVSLGYGGWKSFDIPSKRKWQ